MIIGLVPLYMPKANEINNIKKYIKLLDYCYLLDDSAVNNSSVIQPLIELSEGKAEYYMNTSNIGLCASVNNGFKMAIEKGADWILIMNPDSVFQNDAISIYKHYINKNNTQKTGIICPRFNIDRHPQKPGQGIKRVRYADMTGCLYSVKVLLEIGLFDPNTYFYGLDTEYCLRVRKRGFEIIECSAAVLNHKPAETLKVNILGKTVFKCGIDPPQRYYYQFRSAYYIIAKYHDPYCLAFHIYKYAKVLFFFNNKKEYLNMIRMGIFDARLGFYGKITDRTEE